MFGIFRIGGVGLECGVSEEESDGKRDQTGDTEQDCVGMCRPFWDFDFYSVGDETPWEILIISGMS